MGFITWWSNRVWQLLHPRLNEPRRIDGGTVVAGSMRRRTHTSLSPGMVRSLTRIKPERLESCLCHDKTWADARRSACFSSSQFATILLGP